MIEIFRVLDVGRPIQLVCVCYCIGLSRYIAITNLPITAVFFVEYLRQFLIDFKILNRLREFFELLSSSGFRARRRRDFFCHGMSVTV